MGNRFGRVRTSIDRLTPNFISRHFTWLSATLLGFFVAATFFLVLKYVPGVTTNRFLNIFLSIGAGLATIITVLGALITIHEKLGVTSSDSTNSDEDGLSTPAQGFVRTDEEIMRNAMQSLKGWFSVSKGGEISLHPENGIQGHDRKGMLLVFATRVASDAGEVDNPWVSRKELKDQVGFTSASADVFISKMGDFVNRNFDPEDYEVYRELDDDEIAVQLNVSESNEAAQYIIGERSSPN